MALARVDTQTEKVLTQVHTHTITLELSREEFLAIYSAVDYWEFRNRGSRQGTEQALLNDLIDDFKALATKVY